MTKSCIKSKKPSFPRAFLCASSACKRLILLAERVSVEVSYRIFCLLHPTHQTTHQVFDHRNLNESLINSNSKPSWCFPDWRYCELIAALRPRTTNNAGRYLSMSSIRALNSGRNWPIKAGVISFAVRTSMLSSNVSWSNKPPTLAV